MLSNLAWEFKLVLKNSNIKFFSDPYYLKNSLMDIDIKNVTDEQHPPSLSRGFAATSVC